LEGVMTLTVDAYEKIDNVFVIAPVGKIDITTYAVLEKKIDDILESYPKNLTFDMHEVNYISSAGIRVILKAHKAMKQRGWKVNLLNLQPQVKKVFEIIKALPKEQIFSNVEELDAYLDRIQSDLTR
jgi:anti-sigma B factor antagonist